MTEEEFEYAVSLIRNGDKDGLHRIYIAYAKSVFKVIYEVVQSKEDAEDLTGDVFIKLWEALDSYKPGNGHKGYLMTIARNRAIDFIRKRKREVLMSPDTAGAEDDISQTIFDTGGTYGGDQTGQIPENVVVGNLSIKEAMEKLLPVERQIINMKVMMDMTFKDISETLSIPMGTVTWRYREAINKLRRCGYE